MSSPNIVGNDEFKIGGFAPPTAVLQPGARLRERRELQKLSLESVAMQMHTSAQVVRALEENDIARLPPPVYVRGFLRTYARLLNLPESEVLDTCSAPPAAAPRRVEEEPVDLAPMNLTVRSRPLLSGGLTLGFLAALGLIGWQLLGGQPSPDRQSDEPVMAAPSAAEPEPAAQAALPLPSEAPVAPAPIAPAPSPLPAEVSSPPAATAQPMPTETAAAPEPPSPPPAQAPAPEAAPLPTNALAVKFTGESWVTVVDASGQRLLYEAGLPGTRRTVSGKPPFKVTLGRPGNVSLEFDGQPFVHPYTEKSGPARLKIGG